METTDFVIIGAGSYGTRLAGPIIARKQISGVELKGFVEPNPNINKLNQSPTGKVKPFNIVDNESNQASNSILLYKKREHLLNNLKSISTTIFDFAIPEDIVPKEAINYILAGAKNLILPKPVTFHVNELEILQEKIKKNGVAH